MFALNMFGSKPVIQKPMFIFIKRFESKVEKRKHNFFYFGFTGHFMGGV